MSIFYSTSVVNHQLIVQIRHKLKTSALLPSVTKQLCALVLATTPYLASAADIATPPMKKHAAPVGCDSGSSTNDPTICAKESAAAKQEVKHGQLTAPASDYKMNAVDRCNALPAADKELCQQRISGNGTVEGSVQSGGVMREMTTSEPK